MLTLAYPPTYKPERLYIYDFVLRSFLGLSYHQLAGPPGEVTISLEGDNCKQRLRLDDSFFSLPQDQWLTSSAMPGLPLENIHMQDLEMETIWTQSTLPILFGSRLPNGKFFQSREDGMDLGIDLFGSAFFLLTRYEEVIDLARDSMDRFPAKVSLGVQQGFLDRPIVNETIELLWACLHKMWPRLERAPRSFSTILGHDIDVPLIAGGAAWWEIARGMAGDFLKRRDLSIAAGRLRSMIENRRGNPDADLWNTFGFILDTSERLGLPSTFFFISGHSGGKVDGTYSMEDPWIRSLLREIGQRGHQIGLHPSYNTFLDQDQLGKEFRTLRETVEAEGLKQSKWGGRQHFLRWRAPTTWQLYENVGLNYDATLTYPDRPGFRAGICDPYPVFNLQTRQSLKLVEQPLIVMDEALLGKGPYSMNAVKDSVIALRDRCKRVNGVFSLLWHNGWLISKKARMLYLEILGAQ